LCEPLCGPQIRERILFVAQVSDHQCAQMATRLRQGRARRTRLQHDLASRAQGRRQVRSAEGIEHDQCIGGFNGVSGLGVDGEIAVQVGPGQHDDQTCVRPAGAPRAYGRRRPTRVECDHQRLVSLAPLRDETHTVR
jgi:hypothetical protein